MVERSKEEEERRTKERTMMEEGRSKEFQLKIIQFLRQRGQIIHFCKGLD